MPAVEQQFQPHTQSPSVYNYFVGRGFCSVKLTGEASFQDAGNITSFNFQVKPTILSHFSTRIGVRKKDYAIITELDATLSVSMEEFTARNMAFAILGTVRESPSMPDIVIDMFQQPLMQGAFQFTGTNSAGPQWDILFPLCLFSPSKAVEMIATGAGAWGTIDLQLDVLQDPVTQQFGIFTATDFVSP